MIIKKKINKDYKNSEIVKSNN